MPQTVPAAHAPAPDFTLPSTAGGDVTLSGLQGKPVLLAFFPLAFTRTCTAEFCDFSKELGTFADTGVKVLGISVDMVPSLKAFQAQERITVDLLSDFRRDVSRTYGVLIEEKFHSKRAYFLVDGKGVLRWSHVEAELGHKRDNAELLRQIAALA
ncbi:MAG: redoxin domain-containing protein [Gemmatimonadetes bacterium]|nr:redoxin domain-containing protein [Gemmatimonadota bacterium]